MYIFQKLAEGRQPGAGTPRMQNDPNSTANNVSEKVTLEQIEKNIESVNDELFALNQASSRDDFDEQQLKEPLDERIDKLNTLVTGLQKILNYRRYNLNDHLSDKELAALRELDANLLTMSTDPVNTIRETINPSDSGRASSGSHSFTAQSVGEGLATEGGQPKVESNMPKGAQMSALVNPREAVLTFFADAFFSKFAEEGYYFSEPEAVFVGLYETLSHVLDANRPKTATHGYDDAVVNACRYFVGLNREMEKQALTPGQSAGLGVNLAPPGTPMIQPAQIKIPKPKEQDINMAAMDPDRYVRRQDLIDAMMPYAKSIKSEPDGTVQINMPDQKLDLTNQLPAVDPNAIPPAQGMNPAGAGVQGNPAGPVSSPASPAEGGGIAEDLMRAATGAGAVGGEGDGKFGRLALLYRAVTKSA